MEGSQTQRTHPSPPWPLHDPRDSAKPLPAVHPRESRKGRKSGSWGTCAGGSGAAQRHNRHNRHNKAVVAARGHARSCERATRSGRLDRFPTPLPDPRSRSHYALLQTHAVASMLTTTMAQQSQCELRSLGHPPPGVCMCSIWAHLDACRHPGHLQQGGGCLRQVGTGRQREQHAWVQQGSRGGGEAGRAGRQRRFSIDCNTSSAQCANARAPLPARPQG